MIKRYKDHKQYRLPFFNYASAGLYFITICTHDRKDFLGRIENGKLNPSIIGDIINNCWNNIPASSPYASIDSYILMPNHVHGIIAIENQDQSREIAAVKFAPEKQSLSIVIRNFKAAVSIRVHKQLSMAVIWQSRFYDHIIRNEDELEKIREYIRTNPLQWRSDPDFT